MCRSEREEVGLQEGLESFPLLALPVGDAMDLVGVVRRDDGRHHVMLDGLYQLGAARVFQDPVKHVGIKATLHAGSLRTCLPDGPDNK